MYRLHIFIAVELACVIAVIGRCLQQLPVLLGFILTLDKLIGYIGYEIINRLDMVEIFKTAQFFIDYLDIL